MGLIVMNASLVFSIDLTLLMPMILAISSLLLPVVVLNLAFTYATLAAVLACTISKTLLAGYTFVGSMEA